MMPDLSGAKVIGVDTETRDPDLLTLGPGHYRADSYLVGISLATEDGHKAYYPIRHAGGDNLDEATVISYVKAQLAGNHEKVFTNASYDLPYLKREGILVNGPIRDIQIAEPLIDENCRQYSLGAQAARYLGATKSDDGLNQWCAEHFGGRPTRRGQAGNYWRAPGNVVREYAEDDAWLPIQIWEKQRAIIDRQKLWDIFDLESSLIIPLLLMREQGVMVDIPAAAAMVQQMAGQANNAQLRIDQLAGMHVDVWAAESLAKAFDANGLVYPYTAKGAPSFTKPFLEGCSHPIAEFIRDLRSLDKVRSTFVEGGVLTHHVNGVIHGQYHQLPTDENGAVTGRLSSSGPNLQNLPSGGDVRSLFIPREDERWVKFDYSQVEPRLTLHEALPDAGVNRLRGMYQENPALDCYNLLMEEMKGVTRTEVKKVYLGMTYAMGKDLLAAQLGMNKEDAVALFNRFHAGAPYIRRLAAHTMACAEKDGVVRSLLGRRHRFPLYESRDEWRMPPLPRAEAVAAYGRVRRAFTYKALNRVIQGGAATILKKAIVDCWKSGVWAVTGAPLLNVHDELDHSVPQTPEGDEAMGEITNLMENCVQLRVPLKVDVKAGPNWGGVK